MRMARLSFGVEEGFEWSTRVAALLDAAADEVILAAADAAELEELEAVTAATLDGDGALGLAEGLLVRRLEAAAVGDLPVRLAGKRLASSKAVPAVSSGAEEGNVKPLEAPGPGGS